MLSVILSWTELMGTLTNKTQQNKKIDKNGKTKNW
jgi:hypothetical protein